MKTKFKVGDIVTYMKMDNPIGTGIILSFKNKDEDGQMAKIHWFIRDRISFIHTKYLFNNTAEGDM